jgi:hypothetical protein
MVTIAGRKRKAMVYIMDESQLPGWPSSQYVKTILQRYVNNDMDIGILKKSLEINSIECA